jgi:hypothetical protein
MTTMCTESERNVVCGRVVPSIFSKKGRVAIFVFLTQYHRTIFGGRYRFRRKINTKSIYHSDHGSRFPTILPQSMIFPNRPLDLRLAHDRFGSSSGTLPTPTLITITCTQVLWFLECLARTTVSCYETTRIRLNICLPAQPSMCEAFLRSSCFSV